MVRIHQLVQLIQFILCFFVWVAQFKIARLAEIQYKLLVLRVFRRHRKKIIPDFVIIPNPRPFANAVKRIEIRERVGFISAAVFDEVDGRESVVISDNRVRGKIFFRQSVGVQSVFPEREGLKKYD